MEDLPTRGGRGPGLLRQKKKYFMKSQEIWVLVLILPHPSYTILSESLGFSGLLFPHPSNGANVRGECFVNINLCHPLQKILATRGWRVREMGRCWSSKIILLIICHVKTSTSIWFINTDKGRNGMNLFKTTNLFLRWSHIICMKEADRKATGLL